MLPQKGVNTVFLIFLPQSHDKVMLWNCT